MLPASGEIFREPARQGFDALADEQHAPVRVHAAAEGNARQVADQRTVLLLAMPQGRFHPVAIADVGDEADKQGFASDDRLADRQSQREARAILAFANDLAPLADDLRHALHVVVQVSVVLAAIRFGHQHLDVAADDLVCRPAEDCFGSAVEGTDDTPAVDGDDAVHRGIDNGPHPRFVLHHAPVHGPVAQQHVDAAGDQDGKDGDPCDRQREVCVRAGGRVGLCRHDEARGVHAHVVHAGDCNSEHGAAQDVDLAFAEAQLRGQTEAQPQGQDGKRDRDQDRDAEHRGFEAQLDRVVNGGHAAVVHDADADPDRNPARNELPAGDAVPCEKLQRDPGRGEARKHRQQGDDRIVAGRAADAERQHADEVHRPDARAKHEGAGEQGDLPAVRARVCPRRACQLHGHDAREDGDKQGHCHEREFIFALGQVKDLAVEQEEAIQLHCGGRVFLVPREGGRLAIRFRDSKALYCGIWRQASR